MDERDVRRWVDGYIKAWNTNAPDDIAALFTDDARYYTEPHAQPKEGQAAIVEDWIDRKDEPGETSFEYDVLAIDGDLAIVKGKATYHRADKVYSNLWEIRLADGGRAREFVEWWMKH